MTNKERKQKLKKLEDEVQEKARKKRLESNPESDKPNEDEPSIFFADHVEIKQATKEMRQKP